MPRYHFNVFDGVTVIDQVGSQFANPQEARAAALRIAGEMLKTEAERARLGEEWRVEVTDGRGMILFRIDTLIHASPAIAMPSEG